ncbi:hypothetical protein GO986_10895 [Deinococcus sp. HMF7620]|uniref:Uncharacterized protein n=1 Tax=Deinococcus arboris TaxID=2682977 RepID=A0A7C9LL90_9DEIO|nr:hypothetical protein [Deinococcus arboris]MVN87278.1 hypothetical protein [Deinococcus arboris]
MSFSQWLNSTEAGMVFYPTLGLLGVLLLFSVFFAVFRKRKLLFSVSIVALILAAALTNFFFLEYKSSVQSHFDTITFISRKTFGEELEQSQILLYRMALMVRMFYFQIDFKEPIEARNARITSWNECRKEGGQFAETECLTYVFKYNQFDESETPCEIDPDQPFAIARGKISFDEEQYDRKDYSDVDIVRNPEKTTYCLFWAD